MTWQGGGGYGDPLSREPEAVAHDLREQKITPLAARSVYGVVVIDGGVDAAATAEEREQLRAARRDRSRAPMEQPGGRADLASSRRIDDNLVEAPGPDGAPVVACRHCATVLGAAGADVELALAVHDGPPTEAGPQITANAADYVDASVVLGQYCCPGCWTALFSAVVPADHPDALATVGRLTATVA
jgi:N-methylhydantoinase B